MCELIFLVCRGVAQMGARVVWDHEVAGSSPVTPTNLYAGVAQWQSASLPSWLRGSDSLHPLHINYGGYSSIGRAPDCGSGCCRFETGYPPH